MRFPWFTFWQLVSIVVAAATVMLVFAWAEGSWETGLTVTQMVHQYAWRHDKVLPLTVGFFTYGWQYREEFTPLGEWLDEHWVVKLVVLFGFIGSVLGLLASHSIFGVDWQFLPADLYITLSVPMVAGFFWGSWAQKRWGKRPARTTRPD